MALRFVVINSIQCFPILSVCSGDVNFFFITRLMNGESTGVLLIFLRMG